MYEEDVLSLGTAGSLGGIVKMASSAKIEGSNLTKEGDEKKAEDASNKGRSTTERVSDIS